MSLLYFILSYLWAIISELLLLILFSIPFVLIAQALQYITQKLSIVWGEILGVKSWLIISSPGVIIHELSHALFCLIFRNKIVEIKLFTLKHGNCLGYVRHQYDPNSTYQQVGHLFIGFAPILCGVLLIVWLTQSLMNVDFILDIPQQQMSIRQMFKIACSSCWKMFINVFSLSSFLRWQTLVWLVCLILIGSHITLSPADLQGVDRGWEAIIGAISVYHLFMVKIFPVSAMLILGRTIFIQGFCYMVLTLALLTTILTAIYLIRFLIISFRHPEIPISARLLKIINDMCDDTPEPEEAEKLNNAGSQAYENDDYDTAFRCFSESVTRYKSKFAQFMLGDCYLNGLGTAVDKERARKLFIQAANKGVPAAIWMLGACYLTGSDWQADHKEAFKWLNKYSGDSLPDIYRLKGECFQFGYGVRTNPAKAFKCYKRALDLGCDNKILQLRLGQCCCEGIGVKQDHEEALKYLLPLYSEFDEAKLLIGKCILFGKNDAYTAATCFKQVLGTDFDEEASKLFDRALDKMSAAELERLSAEMSAETPASDTGSKPAAASDRCQYSFTSNSGDDFNITV